MASLVTQRTINLISQVMNIVRYEIRQLAILTVIPHLFNRIQLRSIRRQPFHINSATEAMAKASDARAMYHPTVNNQNNAFGKVCQKLRDKCYEIISTNIAIGNSKVRSQMMAFRRNFDCRDNRKSVPAIPTVMDRRLTFWSPSPAYRRLKHKTAFIKEYDGFTVSLGFFSYAASLSFAKLQWLVHRVLWHVFQASGSSSPYLSRCAKRWKRRS